jgi:hypothetical protein
MRIETLQKEKAPKVRGTPGTGSVFVLENITRIDHFGYSFEYRV